MKHIKQLKIDIDKKSYEVITSVQYDHNTRFLHIKIMNGSIPVDLTGCSVKISAAKPDGMIVFNNCNVINAKEGFVEVELTEQMNAAPGSVKCEIKIYEGNGVLTTKQFYIEVSESVMSKGITSGNEFTALTEALQTIKTIENKVDKSVFTTRVNELESKLNDLKDQFNSSSSTKKSVIWYNARDYGVKGDGRTNDQPKLQELIDIIHSEGGGVLYCPKGIYIMHSQMNWLSGVSLYGDGVGQTIFKTVYNGNTFNLNLSVIGWDKNRQPFSYCTQEHPLYNCHFRDFEIDGSNVVSTSGHYAVGIKGIFLQYMINCSVQDIYVHDTIATGVGIDFLDKTFINNVVVKNCGRGYGVMSGGTLGGAGIGIGTGYLQNENLIISNCQAIGCGSNGIFVEHQNLFAGGGDQGYEAEGVLITNCICKNNRNNGIGVRGGKKVSVTNNIIYGNKDGIKLYTVKCSEIKVSGNISKDNTNSDFIIDDALVENIDISNNTFGGKTLFKYRTESKNIIINSNNEFGPISFPARIKVDGVYITNNVFSEMEGNAISYPDINGQGEISNVVISNNTFKAVGLKTSSNSINVINLYGIVKKTQIVNNSFPTLAAETAGKKYRHIAMHFKPGSEKNSINNNYCREGGTLTHDLTNPANSVNSHFDMLPKVGCLKQQGRSNVVNDGSWAVIETKYRKSLLDMTGYKSFKIKFGQTNNCTLFYQIGQDNKYWSLECSKLNFILKGNGDGSEKSCTITIDKAYKFYELIFDAEGLRINVSDDNTEFKTFKPASGTITDQDVMNVLSVGGPADTILFGGLKNGVVNTLNNLWNYTVYAPLIVYKGTGTTINTNADIVAEYTWNNFGDNKDLIDNINGYNAKVCGVRSLSQIETSQF